MALRQLRALDAFCGEGGMGVGLHRAGFLVEGVDTSKARLRRYPFTSYRADAIEFILAHGHEYDLIHTSPTCTGYSRGTAAIPDRLAKYDRLIAATREALLIVGRPYVIENVEDARSELESPLMLCGSEFDLTAVDEDGTKVQLQRHRLFESNMPLMGNGGCRHSDLPVAGSYGGARRDRWEAKNVRKGGYVPTADVQRDLLGVPWMTETGCRLSIPPAYGQFIGEQLFSLLSAEVSA